MSTATLAEMMSIALDAYIESFHSCKANDECRAIRDEIESRGFVTLFGGLVSMDPFQNGTVNTSKPGSLPYTAGALAGFGRSGGTSAARNAMHADIDRALFNLRHSGHAQSL